MEQKSVKGIKISIVILTLVFIILISSILPRNFCKFISWMGCCEDTIN